MTRTRAILVSAALSSVLIAPLAAGAADGVRITPSPNKPSPYQVIPCAGYPKEKAGPQKFGPAWTYWTVYQLQPRDCSYKAVKTCSQYKGGFKQVTNCTPI